MFDYGITPKNDHKDRTGRSKKVVLGDFQDRQNNAEDRPHHDTDKSTDANKKHLRPAIASHAVKLADKDITAEKHRRNDIEPQNIVNKPDPEIDALRDKPRETNIII